MACHSRRLCCVEKDTSVAISVQNAKGQDLLNPKTPGAFLRDKIKLFYKAQGEPVEEVYYPNADLPRNFDLRKVGSRYRITVFVNEAAGRSDTYIQWDETDTDTLSCQIERKGGSVFCREVWFNGRLKWPLPGKKTERAFSIQK